MNALPSSAGDASSHPPRRLFRSQQQSDDTSARIADGNERASKDPPIALVQGQSVQDDGVHDCDEAYENLPGLDLLAKLGKDWPAKVLAASKWQTKKEMLDELLSITLAPKLLSSDYSEVRRYVRWYVPPQGGCLITKRCLTKQLIKSLRILLSDSMVLVVASAIKAIGNLI